MRCARSKRWKQLPQIKGLDYWREKTRAHVPAFLEIKEYCLCWNIKEKKWIGGESIGVHLGKEGDWKRLEAVRGPKRKGDAKYKLNRVPWRRTILQRHHMAKLDALDWKYLSSLWVVLITVSSWIVGFVICYFPPLIISQLLTRYFKLLTYLAT